MVKVYFNTSLIISAVNSRDPNYDASREFIRDCYRLGHKLFVSTLLFVEVTKRNTLRAVKRLIKRYGFIVVKVNVDYYLEKAYRWCSRRGYSRSRIPDVAHMMVARDIGFRYLAANDRFMKSHASEFNLAYINFYTGCPRK